MLSGKCYLGLGSSNGFLVGMGVCVDCGTAPALTATQNGSWRERGNHSGMKSIFEGYHVVPSDELLVNNKLAILLKEMTLTL